MAKEIESKFAKDARVRKLFDTLDTKGEGYLDLKGLRDGLKRLDHPLQNTEKLLQQLLKTCDTSGDGLIQFEGCNDPKVLLIGFKADGCGVAIDRDDNGELDRAELAEALRINGLHVDSDRLEQFFEQLDKNNDGHITFEEWRDFLVFIPSFDPGMKAIYSYYLATVSVSAEGDVTVSDDLYDGLGYFIAGGLAGAISRTATAPFDRLKVYLIAQTDMVETKAKIGEAVVQGDAIQAAKKATRPMQDALRALWRAGGVRSLFAGNGLNVVKVLPESAIKFGSFEAAKRAFAQIEGVEDVKQISSVSKFLAGGVGGVASQIASYPVDTIKFRMQCDLVEGGLRGNQLILDTTKRLWAAGGVPAFYRGLPMGLMGIFPYSAIDLGMFEWMKKAYIKSRVKLRGCHDDDVQVPNWLVLAIGATSGSIGASLVYPLNLLRTRLQAQGTAQHPQTYTGMWDVTTKTFAKEGYRGFFKGLTPNLLKVAPAVSISYLVYENSKRVMGLR